MNIKFLILILVFSFLLSSVKTFSQVENIEGIVVDSLTEKPLPFVNIIYNKKKEGLSSNIDGSFQINRSNNVEFLQFSYLGYQTKTLSLNDLLTPNGIVLKLSEQSFDIEQVTVFAGENPAHRIINKVIENRKRNNPEELNSYSYKSYDKMVLTYDLDQALKEVEQKGLNVDSLMRDASYINAKAVLDSLYFFMLESLSERQYQKPDKIQEIVIATKASGLKEASFFALATQLQSLSFYNEIITLAESRYINPISRGSTRRYFFTIEDTTYTQRGDTIFRISYKPKKGKNFESLKGVLSINTHKYALQNVIAQPVNDDGIINIEIQQKYDLMNDEFWFPTQLHTNMIINSMPLTSGSLKMKAKWVSKAYLYDIKINEGIKQQSFSLAQIEIEKKALEKDSIFWVKNRKIDLNEKEKSTYHFIDSIGEQRNLDLKMKFMNALFQGYIPVGLFDVNLNHLMSYNEFEKTSLGLGLRTNSKIASFFSLGGYFSYGFNDENYKYGGSLLLNIYKKRDLKVEFSYRNDVKESSGYNFLERESLSSTEIYRNYLVSDMTYFKEYSASLQLMPLKYFTLNLVAAQQEMTSNIFSEFTSSNFFETSLQFRFAPNENLAFLNNQFVPITSLSSPILVGNVMKGFNLLEGDYQYLKLETKLQISFLTKAFGKTDLQIVGGKIWGELPYFKQYNGHGNYSNFETEAANSFATMRMNEFLSDEFVAVYFRQDFGGLLFKTENFKPKILFISSLTYGRLHEVDLNYNKAYKTMEKGYFESGILLNSLIRQFKFIGYGFGVFYRYGNYALENNNDNFAYKFSITLEL